MTADLLGAVAGPWTVTNVDAEGWHEITHVNGSTRLLKAYAAEDLVRGARRNGLAGVRAQAPRATKPIEAIPHYAAGDVTTKGWE